MLLYWLWLAQCNEVKDGVKAALVRRFEDPERLFFAEKQEILDAEIEGLTGEHLDVLLRHDLSAAEETLSDCAKAGLQVLTYDSPLYPRRLKAIYDPPIVLYYRGTLPDFNKLPTIGVVGTRHPSVYGRQAAKRLGGEIAAAGGLVVSGLAEGIDGAAMEAALSAGFPAVGVLGCGADVVYPRKHKALFQETERLGCILSEYAPGSPPLGWHFPRRNRIISGLSCGVVVVEAPERSGSLLTAKHALEQGRDVFVVPGNVDMESFRGSNRLLRSGAIAVSSGRDVMEEYDLLYPEKLLPKKGLDKPKKAEKQEPKPEAPEILKKKTIDNGNPPPYSGQNDILQGLSADEQTVMTAIGTGIESVDDVIAKTGLPSGKVLGILTMLEIRKKIVRHPGKRVSRRQ
ncbi:DNA-processing protein DprA [Pseudoflavonifractor sp. MSJ-30]|uniref:DNA-processing protein DprA n=1 Tax=Pseudoflavonifractor sp. MSJ-30 TaxID=2841525 RepID=UPI001C0F724A|nr:DNA-processing protein DprA [Pseudoflavonifractor sp. MSJ-30]MBU5452143.1 DNA-processing protein DprA [Pseudoflavonifractor sp. MSJ-30]